MKHLMIGLLLTVPFSVHALDVDVFDRGGHTEISLDGTFEAGDAKKLDAAYVKAARAKKRVSIYLNAVGGAPELYEPLRKSLSAVIDKEYGLSGKRVPFVVFFQCGGLCNPLAAYVNKAFVRDSQKVEYYTSVDTEFVFAPLKGGDRSKNEKKLFALYLDAGISSVWLNMNAKSLKQSQGVTYTGSEICSGTSLIVPPTSCGRELEIEELIKEQMKPVK